VLKCRDRVLIEANCRARLVATDALVRYPAERWNGWSTADESRSRLFPPSTCSQYIDGRSFWVFVGDLSVNTFLSENQLRDTLSAVIRTFSRRQASSRFDVGLR